MSRRVASAVAVALVSVHIVASACATAPETDESPVAISPEGLVATSTAANRPANPGGIGADDKAASQGVVRVQASYPMSPDPAVIESSDVLLTSYDLIREIHAGLIAVVDDPHDPFVPDLAQSFEISDSFTRFRFKLRQGLRFSDGFPLTAADFKWSWERALRLGGREVWLALGTIDGADAFRTEASSELSGVDVIDDETLEVVLTHPDPGFLARMAAPASFVLRRENVEKWLVNPGEGVPYSYLRSGARVMPAGAGPFAVSAVRISGVYELVPNRFYHGKLPVALVELSDAPRSVGPDILFETNEIDAYHVGKYDGESNLPLPKSDVNGGEIVLSESANALRFLALNDSKPPFDDIEFRRAAIASVNRYGNLGLRDTSAPRIEADPEIALSHLSSSGYVERVHEFASIMYVTNPGSFQREFEIVSLAWNNILGLETRYRSVDVFSPSTLAAGDDVGFVIEEVKSAHPSDESVIEQLVSHLADISSGAGTLKVVQMLANARESVDPVERSKHFKAVAAALVSDALVAPLYWFPEVFATMVRTNIEGFRIPKYGGSRFAGIASNHAAH